MTSPALDSLGPALADHLPSRRWFGAKDRAISGVRVTASTVLREPGPAAPAPRAEPVSPGLVQARAEVRFAGGDPVEYQLLVGLRPPDAARAVTVGDPQALIGEVDWGGRRLGAYDAVVDADLGLLLLEVVAPGRTAKRVRALGAEQSNSSLVYDDDFILKVFRRLRPGANPEVEMVQGLAGVSFGGVPEPVAAWRRDGYDLALVQRFLAGGDDGWALAVRSARTGSPGHFADEAARLGSTTADLHRALTGAFGASPGEAARWADDISHQLNAIDLPGVDPSSARGLLERLGHLDDPGMAVRAHGDYHLGQVMRTGERWFVLDFEGEPARSFADRRRPTSPLRDVAGMLRSFHYASTFSTSPAAWERCCRDAFLGAYLAAGSDLLPRRADDRAAVLGAFELEKAVYELGYEQSHRPDWVGIPVEALRRLSGAR